MAARSGSLLALVLAISAVPAFAGVGVGTLSPDPWLFPAEAEEGMDFVREGLRADTIMAADFDADGNVDQVLIVRNTEQRVLLVLMANKHGGFRRIGIGELDPHPLGDTALSAPKGVLVIEDLTGGTSAIQSTYRYRYEKATDRMRLIGDDVSSYSRTWQHGTTTISTNRITGKRITTVNDVVGAGENASLGPDKATTSKLAVEPKLYLEDAPSPEQTLGLGSE